jgi:hypothetical protein
MVFDFFYIVTYKMSSASNGATSGAGNGAGNGGSTEREYTDNEIYAMVGVGAFLLVVVIGILIAVFDKKKQENYVSYETDDEKE